MLSGPRILVLVYFCFIPSTHFLVEFGAKAAHSFRFTFAFIEKRVHVPSF